MKQYVLITDSSDEKPSAFDRWLLERINEFPCDIGRAALILFPSDDSDVGCYTAHFNMNTCDLAEAANNMLFDSIDSFIKANLGRYRSFDTDEDGCAIDTDIYEEEEDDDDV